MGWSRFTNVKRGFVHCGRGRPYKYLKQFKSENMKQFKYWRELSLQTLELHVLYNSRGMCKFAVWKIHDGRELERVNCVCNHIFEKGKKRMRKKK
jgi:hypothetical protein